MTVIFFVSRQPVWARQQQPIDIVIDLDWTLIYEITAVQYRSGDPDYFEFEGKYYRLSDGVREFITVLLRLPGVRISFFSGGPEARNDFILRNTFLFDGRSLREVAFRALDLHDLIRMDEAPGDAKFSERFKKNLRLVAADLELDWSILIDDIEKFLVPGQEKNMLWLQRTLDYVEDRRTISRANRHDKYSPPDERTRILERNKLAWALGMILTAYEHSRATGVSFREAVNAIQFEQNGERIDREQIGQEWLYEFGLKKMRIINPKMRYLPMSKAAMPTACRQLFMNTSFSSH